MADINYNINKGNFSGSAKLGDVITLDEALDKSRNKMNPILPWIYGEELKEKSNETSDSKSNVFEFNKARRGWSYSWQSNKHTCDTLHCLQVYVFEELDVQTGSGQETHEINSAVLSEKVSKYSEWYKGLEITAERLKTVRLRCVSVAQSSKFMLFCRRRRRFAMKPSAPNSRPLKMIKQEQEQQEREQVVDSMPELMVSTASEQKRGKREDVDLKRLDVLMKKLGQVMQRLQVERSNAKTVEILSDQLVEQMLDDIAQYLLQEKSFKHAVEQLRTSNTDASQVVESTSNEAYAKFLRVAQDHLETYRRSRNISMQEFEQVFTTVTGQPGHLSQQKRRLVRQGGVAGSSNLNLNKRETIKIEPKLDADNFTLDLSEKDLAGFDDAGAGLDLNGFDIKDFDMFDYNFSQRSPSVGANRKRLNNGRILNDTSFEKLASIIDQNVVDVANTGSSSRRNSKSSKSSTGFGTLIDELDFLSNGSLFGSDCDQLETYNFGDGIDLLDLELPEVGNQVKPCPKKKRKVNVSSNSTSKSTGLSLNLNTVEGMVGHWKRTEKSNEVMQAMRKRCGTPWILSKMFEFMENKFEISYIMSGGVGKPAELVYKLQQKWLSNKAALTFVLDNSLHSWGIKLPVPFSQLSHGWQYKAFTEIENGQKLVVVVEHFTGRQKVIRRSKLSDNGKVLYSTIILQEQDASRNGLYNEIARCEQEAVREEAKLHVTKKRSKK